MAQLRFGRKTISLPQTRVLRMGLGLLLVVGGLLGFLPVLGFWMIPLGIIILSVDMPSIRRFRRRIQVRWGYFRETGVRKRNGDRQL